MKNKGFTVIELIASFTLTSLIVALLFEVVFMLKNLYTDAGVKAELLTKQAIISEKINDDFVNKKLQSAATCGDACVDFTFSDDTTTRLTFNRNEKTLAYGDYNTTLISGSQFGNIEISAKTVVGVSSITNDGILTIKIPIYHKYFKQEDFGINIVYQYDSTYASLSGLFISDILDKEKTISLIGTIDDIAFKGIAYNDPGYRVTDSDGNIVDNDPSVIVKNEIGEEVNKTYSITYSILDTNGNVIDKIVRRVTLIDTETTFNYSGSKQEYTVPVNGLYKIEVWGAQGGSTGSSAIGGKGGYTVGQINLTKGTSLNIYVGGAGNFSQTTSSTGGFNGGGTSGAGSELSGASGGGASDVRKGGDALTNRIIVAGGGGGTGGKNDSSSEYTGGSGGGLEGLIGTYGTASYNGQPGTSSTGGAAATYSENVTVSPTAGSLGIGGNGGSYAGTYGGGGAGGGYYGGGGGVRYGTGAGGSGYCGTLLNCTSYNGTQTFASINGKTETGHEGNGNIKITLISINS